MDGFQLCQEVRRISDVPIVMLSARDGEVDKVRGLEMGADDYITKPFSHLELLARVRAVCVAIRTSFRSRRNVRVRRSTGRLRQPSRDREGRTVA